MCLCARFRSGRSSSFCLTPPQRSNFFFFDGDNQAISLLHIPRVIIGFLLRQSTNYISRCSERFLGSLSVATVFIRLLVLFIFQHHLPFVRRAVRFRFCRCELFGLLTSFIISFTWINDSVSLRFISTRTRFISVRNLALHTRS